MYFIRANVDGKVSKNVRLIFHQNIVIYAERQLGRLGILHNNVHKSSFDSQETALLYVQSLVNKKQNNRFKNSNKLLFLSHPTT